MDGLVAADEEDDLGCRGSRVGDLRGRGDQGGDTPGVDDLGTPASVARESSIPLAASIVTRPPSGVPATR
jgi:hypothetical protein